jgi:SprT-like family
MDSDPVLSKGYQALFDEFNARYFHGRLPPYRIRVVEHIPGREGPAGLHQRTHKRILIRRSDDDDMIVTLLHEMAHAVTVDKHNSRWRTQMQRLRQAGAPIPDGELRTPIDQIHTRKEV